MPLYIYRCTRCEREIEELQKFEDPPPRFEDELCPAARDGSASTTATEEPCNFERVPSSVHFDFPHASLDNVGRAGWKLTDQGVVYRHIQGK